MYPVPINLSSMAVMDLRSPEELTTVQMDGLTGTSTSGTLQLISMQQRLTVSFYIFSFSILICIFGIFSNLVNIIVFYKMGFSKPSNISLFCLAVVDLATLAFILLVSLTSHPGIYIYLEAGMDITLFSIARAAASPFYSFCAVGAWITAVINIERSCCVAFPLQVSRLT